MSDNLLLLVVSEAKLAVRPEDSLEDRLRAAMKASYRHWMVTDEDTQFRGAIGAVYSASEDEDEKARIEAELASLRDMNALLSGVPIDLERVSVPEHPLGLMKMWKEVTAPLDGSDTQ